MRFCLLFTIGFAAAPASLGCIRQSDATPARTVEVQAPLVKAGREAAAAELEPVAARNLGQEKPAVQVAQASQAKPHDGAGAEQLSLPGDKAGKLLERILEAGAGSAGPLSERQKPLVLPGLRSLEKPQMPEAPLQPAPPEARRLLPVRTESRPCAVSESVPFLREFRSPAGPAAVMLPVNRPIRLESVDVNQPVPLPVLSQPVRDRAALADPTAEASVAAALGAVRVVRDQPVPFSPINLPDPFEHSQAVRLREVPAESPYLPLATPRTPGK